jgi:hypothetical protein
MIADTQTGRIIANLRFTDEHTSMEFDTRKERLQRFLAIDLPLRHQSRHDDHPALALRHENTACYTLVRATSDGVLSNKLSFCNAGCLDRVLHLHNGQPEYHLDAKP